ncbi:hypothetical protein BGZ60DRAFT_411512, partial [Tricladium varicosporioides]
MVLCEVRVLKRTTAPLLVNHHQQTYSFITVIQLNPSRKKQENESPFHCRQASYSTLIRSHFQGHCLPAAMYSPKIFGELFFHDVLHIIF